MDFDFEELVSEYANAWNTPIARHLGASFADGLAQDAGWTTSTVPELAIFPAKSSDLLVFEEGIRRRGVLKVYGRVGSVVGGVFLSEEDSRRADVFEWQGHVWQVVGENNYGPSGRFMETTAAKVAKSVSTIAGYLETLT